MSPALNHRVRVRVRTDIRPWKPISRVAVHEQALTWPIVINQSRTMKVVCFQFWKIYSWHIVTGRCIRTLKSDTGYKVVPAGLVPIRMMGVQLPASYLIQSLSVRLPVSYPPQSLRVRLPASYRHLIQSSSAFLKLWHTYHVLMVQLQLPYGTIEDG